MRGWSVLGPDGRRVQPQPATLSATAPLVDDDLQRERKS